MFNYQTGALPGFSREQDNPYYHAPVQQQQAPAVNPMGIMNAVSGQGGMPSMFGGGGGGAASAGGAGGSSGGSAISSAGPWAALAAVIIGNEYNARGQGRRSEDKSDYAQDLLGGKVLEQDMPYFADKLFGKDDKYGFGEGLEAFGDLSTGDFSNAFKSLGNRFKKIF